MKLPEYVANKPELVKKKWLSIKGSYESENLGLVIANKWLQSRQESVTLENLSFITDSEQITFRSIGGDEYVDFILTDKWSDSYGTKASEGLMKEIAELVNSGKVNLVGDFNHELLDELQKQGYSKEEIKNRLRNFKQGVAKAVKAIYENGKLYLRALINPRYKKRIMNSKGVSIEGSFVRKGDTFVGGTILGFSFIDAADKQPGNKRARILR
jgi:hypothetical protein